MSTSDYSWNDIERAWIPHNGRLYPPELYICPACGGSAECKIIHNEEEYEGDKTIWTMQCDGVMSHRFQVQHIAEYPLRICDIQKTSEWGKVPYSVRNEFIAHVKRVRSLGLWRDKPK